MKEILNQFSLDIEYKALISGVSEGRIPAVVSGICDSARPFFVASVLNDVKKKGIVIVSGEKEAYAVAEALRLFYDKVFCYPSRDFVFENVTAYSREWEHERLSVQYAVANDDYDIIVTVPEALRRNMGCDVIRPAE